MVHQSSMSRLLLLAALCLVCAARWEAPLRTLLEETTTKPPAEDTNATGGGNVTSSYFVDRCSCKDGYVMTEDLAPNPKLCSVGVKATCTRVTTQATIDVCTSCPDNYYVDRAISNSKCYGFTGEKFARCKKMPTASGANYEACDTTCFREIWVSDGPNKIIKDFYASKVVVDSSCQWPVDPDGEDIAQAGKRAYCRKPKDTENQYTACGGCTTGFYPTQIVLNTTACKGESRYMFTCKRLSAQTGDLSVCEYEDTRYYDDVTECPKGYYVAQRALDNTKCMLSPKLRLTCKKLNTAATSYSFCRADDEDCGDYYYY